MKIEKSRPFPCFFILHLRTSLCVHGFVVVKSYAPRAVASLTCGALETGERSLGQQMDWMMNVWKTIWPSQKELAFCMADVRWFTMALEFVDFAERFCWCGVTPLKKRCWWVSEFCNQPYYRTQDKGNRLALWKDVHYQEYLAKASTPLKLTAETWKFPFEKEKSSTKPFWGRAESSTERCLKHLYAFVCSSSLIERFFLPKVMDIKWWNAHNMLTCVLRAFRHDFIGCSLSWWPGNVYISLEFVKVFDELLK